MYDPIKGPPHQYLGPSTGDSTEHGDNWFAAVRKINDGFKNIIARLENGVSDIVSGKDPDARDRVSELEDHVRALDERIALLEAKIGTLDDFLTPTADQLTDEQVAEIKAVGPGPDVLVDTEAKAEPDFSADPDTLGKPEVAADPIVEQAAVDAVPVKPE